MSPDFNYRHTILCLLIIAGFPTLGQGQDFQAAPTYGVHFTPQSVAVGDLNHDGKLDVAVANQNSSDISVLLGNGDGTFQPQTQIPIPGSSPVSLVVADLNADGKLDIAVADSVGGNVYVLLGNGDGTFQTPVGYPAGRQPSSVAVGDINGDGYPDLAVSNFADNTVSVLLNNGNGAFGVAANYSVDVNPNSIVIADVNMDGKPDLVVANQGSNDVSVLYQGANGFTTATNYCLTNPPPGVPCSSTAPIQPWAVTVGDLNGDGFPDIAVADNIQTVSLLLSSGAPGVFQLAHLNIGCSGCSQVVFNPRAITIADFNGDGKQDLAVAIYGADSYWIFPGNGDGTFGTALEFESGTQPSSIAVGDFNGDGKPDLVITNSGERDIAVALGNGDETFRAARGFAVGLNPNSMVLGDFNNDGKLDLLVENGGTFARPWTASFLAGNGDGTFAAATSVSLGNDAPFALAAGDFNRDGNLDFAVAYQNANYVGLFFGNGTGMFALGPTYSADVNPAYIAVGDLNGDGSPDLAVANSGVNSSGKYDVSVLLNNGDGTFTPAVNYDVSASPSWIAIGDLNGDGLPDLAVTSPSSGSVSVLLNTGRGAFGAAVAYPIGNSLSVAIADVNGDGNADLVVVGGDTVSVLLGTGGGNFATAVSYPLPANSLAYRVSVADVTGDGILDIIVADLDGNQVSILAGNGDGTFQGAVNYNVGIGPEWLVVGDFNGDGKLDAATANSVTNDVTVLLNATPSQKVASSTALSSSLNPSVFGQSVALTATVTSGGGVPTGTVTFKDSGNTLGAGTLNASGQATLGTTTLAVGSHTITAIYGGDTRFAGSTSTPVSQTVNQASTSTMVASSLNPAVVGQTVTLTATVTPQYGGSSTGSVTFYDGVTAIGSSVLSGNAASFTTSWFTAGSHSITAVYGGDTNFIGSTSAVSSQVVNKAATTTALVSNLNPSLVGQAVTFTATVTGQYGGTPTGSVTFKQGTITLSTVALANAQASFTTTYTTSGQRSITAQYAGDGNFLGSASATVKQIVNKVSTSTALSPSQNPSNLGQTVTFTATVTPTNSSLGLPSPSGTVTFKDGTTQIGTGIISGGTATFTTSSLAAGIHRITARYGGDANYLGSISLPVSEVINGLATTTTITSGSDPSSYGQGVTFTSMVTANSGSGVPTGTVTFKSGTTTLARVPLNNGTAAYTTSTLSAGTKSITAVYHGDSTYAASMSPALSQVITRATTATLLASSTNPSTSGQAVTFTATVSPQYSGTPTGSVTFRLGKTTILATVNLSGGTASYTTSTLPTGSDTIRATYSGSGNFSRSSTSITQTVN